MKSKIIFILAIILAATVLNNCGGSSESSNATSQETTQVESSAITEKVKTTTTSEKKIKREPEVITDQSITTGTDLAGFPIYPGSTGVVFLALDYAEGDKNITIQINSVAPGSYYDVSSWYQDQLLAAGWEAFFIQMNSGLGSEREEWIESQKSAAKTRTTLNVFFEKVTGAGLPVRLVFHGPKTS